MINPFNTSLLKQPRQWLQHNIPRYRRHITLAMLCILIATTLWTIDKTVALYHETVSHQYGNDVSQIASDQLTQTVVNRNLITLQSHLNELVNSPSIINGTIYTLENQVMVQAGKVDSSQLPNHYHSFTSPIVFDDTLLGALNLTLDIPATYPYSPMLTLLFVMAALIAGIRWLNILPLQPHALTKTSTARGEPLPHHQTSYGQPNEYSASLYIHFHSLGIMQQQLNAEARDQQFERFNTTLQQCLTIYNGQSLSLTPQGLTLLFAGRDASTTLFHAICCALLLREIQHQNHTLLNYAMVIDEYEATQRDIFHMKQVTPFLEENERVFIRAAVLEQADIKARVLLEHKLALTDYTEITGLTESYTTLLHNQIKALKLYC